MNAIGRIFLTTLITMLISQSTVHGEISTHLAVVITTAVGVLIWFGLKFCDGDKRVGGH